MSEKTLVIKELINSYNKSVSLLSVQLAVKIANIQKYNSMNLRTKQLLIQLLNKQYNNIIMELKKKLYIDIQNANLLPNVIKRMTKKALLIGLNYVNTNNELYGCINDIYNIKKLLQDLFIYEDIETLTDNTTKLTKQTIIEKFTNLLKNSTINDNLFFAFSGHGTYERDLNNDEIDGRDEAIVTNNGVVILDDELNQIIKTYLKPGVKLFALFDCCFSGTILDLKYNVDKLDNVIVNNNSSDTLGEVIMISGCTDNQYSADAFFNNKASGAMTYAFITTVNNLGKSITFKNLLQNMRTLLSNNGFDQIPQLSSGTPINISTKTLNTVI